MNDNLARMKKSNSFIVKPKTELRGNFSPQYQYILQKTVRNLSAGWCQIDATLHSLELFTVIFVTFAKET